MVRTAWSGRGEPVLQLSGVLSLPRKEPACGPAAPWSPGGQTLALTLSVPAARVPPPALCLVALSSSEAGAGDPPSSWRPRGHQACPVPRLAHKASRPVGAPQAAPGFFPPRSPQAWPDFNLWHLLSSLSVSLPPASPSLRLLLLPHLSSKAPLPRGPCPPL